MAQNLSPIHHILQPHEQLFFVHIPKTGGMTLRHFLSTHFHRDEIYFNKRELLHEEHRKPNPPMYRLVGGHLIYADSFVLPGKPVYFTFLREPVERLISQYEFHRTNAATNPQSQIAIGKAQYTLAVENEFEDWIHLTDQNRMTRMLSCDALLTSSLYALHNAPLDFSLAKERLGKFACIGITDLYQQSVQMLCYTFAWPPPYQVAHLNASKRRRRSDNLPPQVVDTIRELNHHDVELYECGRRLFEERYAIMMNDLLNRAADSFTCAERS